MVRMAPSPWLWGFHMVYHLLKKEGVESVPIREVLRD
jgi:hypothetical protein